MKPVIGITSTVGRSAGGETVCSMQLELITAVEEAGGLPVMLPLTEDREILTQIASLCAGFIFTNGPDLDPAVYSEAPVRGLRKYHSRRDRTEARLLRQIIVRNKPVLGISRGHNLINAEMGGTFIPDLEAAGQTGHAQKFSAHEPYHSILLVKDTPLYELMKEEEIHVNSLHTQAIDKLGRGLEPMAWSEDGVLEAAYIPSRKFAWSLQWDPEMAPEWESTRRIFQEFIDACQR